MNRRNLFAAFADDKPPATKSPNKPHPASLGASVFTNALLRTRGKTGVTCQSSGPYKCASHTSIVVFFKQGEKFPNCPPGSNTGHSTTWAMVSLTGAPEIGIEPRAYASGAPHARRFALRAQRCFRFVVNPVFHWRRAQTILSNFPENLDLSFSDEYHSSSNSETTTKSKTSKYA